MKDLPPLLYALHQPDGGPDQDGEHYGGGDAEDSDRPEQARQRHGAIHRCRLSGQPVADAGGEEPDPHDESAGARGRKLGHGAQPDRAQAQLAQRLQQVRADEPVWPDLRAADYQISGGHQDGEGQAAEQQAQREFARAGWLPAGHRQPDPGEDRRQQDDENRLHALIPACRERVAEDGAIGAAFGEEAERRAGLLVGSPEEGGGDEQYQDGGGALAFHGGPGSEEDQPGEDHHGDAEQAPAEPVGDHRGVEFDDTGPGECRENPEHRRADDDGANRTLLLAQILFGIAGGGWVQTRRPQMPAGHKVLDDSGQHAQTGYAEAQPPTDAFADVAAEKRRDRTEEIDPHVENGKAGVAARIALRVQLAHDRADVALEQAR